VGAGFAATGLAFSLANLLLARFLSPEDYGLVALIVGILGISTPVAPLGADLVVLRGFTAKRSSFYTRATATGAIVAAVVTGWAWAQYRLEPAMLLLIASATIVGGLAYLSAAALQARQRFWIALCLAQNANLALLASAAVSGLIHGGGAALPLWIVLAGYAAAAAVGWHQLATVNDEPKQPFPWAHAISLIVANAASLIFMQIERLVAPSTLGLANVAMFGVAATLVGSPFRILQASVGYTMVPRLRITRSVAERRRLIAAEGGVAASASVAAGALVWFVAPPVAHWFLNAKYHLEPALMAAVLLAGVLRVFSAFVTSIVTALGGTRRLGALGIIAWIAVALGTAGAIIGARWGLPGLVFGVAVGWFVRCVAVSALALPYLRD
jgi:PST family polysaccharide transporter